MFWWLWAAIVAIVLFCVIVVLYVLERLWCLVRVPLLILRAVGWMCRGRATVIDEEGDFV